MIVQVFKYEYFTRSVLLAKLVDEIEADEIPEEYEGDFIQVEEKCT